MRVRVVDGHVEAQRLQEDVLVRYELSRLLLKLETVRVTHGLLRSYAQPVCCSVLRHCICTVEDCFAK